MWVWIKPPESGFRVASPPQMTLANQQTQQLGSLPNQIFVNYKTFEAIVKTYIIKLQNHDKKLIRKEVQLRPRQNEIQYLSTVKAKLITFQA